VRAVGKAVCGPRGGRVECRRKTRGVGCKVSGKDLLEMTASISSAVLDTQAIRDKIFEEFDAARNSEQRGSLLAMFKATMDVAEVYVAKPGNAKRLAEFKEARADDYARLLLRESSVGSAVSPETLLAVTSRESAAGRLTPNDATRLLARPKAERDFDYTSLMSSALTDTQPIRDQIFKDFDDASTVEQRCALLADFKVAMDIAEFIIGKSGDAKRLAEFKETRADDYDRLLIKESTTDGTLNGELSPEMLMAVTNREIAAGRLKPNDAIRQIAVKQAAAPHASHADMVAREEAKKASGMSIQSLVEYMKTATNKDIREVRDRIDKEFKVAPTSEQRGTLLALFTAFMDAMERGLAAHGDQKLLEDFKGARAQDYKIFIVQECTVGLDTPVVGGDVSVDMLMAVTNREIAAGRMTEDHSMRKIALEGAAHPHLSHAELVAKHAKLKAETTSQPKTPASNDKAAGSRTAYAFGAVLGRKLKGLFRKQ
jgi:hypothetical protein